MPFILHRTIDQMSLVMNMCRHRASLSVYGHLWVMIVMQAHPRWLSQAFLKAKRLVVDVHETSLHLL